MRQSRSLDALLPVLYLRSASSGDFQEALAAQLGPDAPNLSPPGVISRLMAGWQQDYDRWLRRDLSARSYVCIRADGVYLQARMEPTAECMPVVIGATPEGRKERLGCQVGVRESARRWRALRGDLKARGLGVPPKLAVGDGAGVLEGAGRGLPRHPPPALLVPQDVERPQPLPQVDAARRRRRPARDPARCHQRKRRWRPSRASGRNTPPGMPAAQPA